jgi:hypothetical protein
MSVEPLDEPEPGGCRRLIVGGCQLAFAGYLLLFLVVVVALFILLWAGQLIWSFF